MDFDAAFAKLTDDKHEGGYVNDPKDPGGETKFGISKRSYPNVDIAQLTLDQAKAIYLRDFWRPAQCDLLPDPIRFEVFDMAVNSGVSAAIKLLQRTVCVTADGVVGPQTLTAIRAMPAPRFVAHFNAYRLAFYAALPSWPAFGRGWTLRCVDNILSGT